MITGPADAMAVTNSVARMSTESAMRFMAPPSDLCRSSARTTAYVSGLRNDAGRNRGAGASQRLPVSDVRPFELAAHGHDVRRLLHQRVVDGDGRRVVVTLARDARELGRVPLERLAQDAGPPDEHPGGRSE